MALDSDQDTVFRNIIEMVKEEVEKEISEDELKKSQDEADSGYDQSKFNYGVALLSTGQVDNQARAVPLLQGLYTRIHKTSQFFNDADKDLARACLYYIALGYFKLAKFRQVRDYGKLLLQITPNHQQMKALLALVDEAEGIRSISEIAPESHANEKQTEKKKKRGIIW